jgi:hypothetical protein
MKGVPRDFFFKYYTKSNNPKDVILQKAANYLKRLLPSTSDLFLQQLFKIYNYFHLDEEVY